MSTAVQAYAPNFAATEDEGLQKKLNPEDALKLALLAIATRLEKVATDRVGRRSTVEQRWLLNLQQYHGQYPTQLAKELYDANKSVLFINQTRPKTNSMAARLSDLLFPTDDKNWAVAPTPVPELSKIASEAAREEIKAAEALKMAQEAQEAQAAQAAAQPPADPNAPPAPDAAPVPAVPDPMAEQMQKLKTSAEVFRAEVRRVRTEIAAAKRAGELMEREIDDQLRECSYQAAMRDVIENACKLGIGVCKGPVLTGKRRRAWKQQEQPTANGGTAKVYTLDQGEDDRPSFVAVNPWNFFPDPDAPTIADSDGVFERHLMTKKQVRGLQHQPGFDKNALRSLLLRNPRATIPQYFQDLRSITGETASMVEERYIVWEYHGPLTVEDLEILAVGKDRPEYGAVTKDRDPLEEIDVTIWFCDGEILKFGIHPLDSCEPIYSVFNLEKDESSVFGFGVPDMMRDTQSALNAAWRMMMDNASLSTGPQILIDKDQVDPVDGKWGLAPRKLWHFKFNASSAGKQNLPFATFDIPMHQAELANIIEIAMKFIDDETGLPLIAQGEQGAQHTQTLGGMSILMNSANVVFRRIVKNFDDDMTVPNIRRIYDFNMQYSKKEYIKGDMNVDARGSSVLLVREMQAQNLMAICLQFAAHPVFGPILKSPQALRLLLKAMMQSPDEIVLTDEEIEEAARAAASMPAAEDPMLALKKAEIDAKVQISNQETDAKLKVAEQAHETAMMQLAAKMNLTLDQVKMQLADKQADRDSKERMMAVELADTKEARAIEGANAPTGGGNF